MKNDLPSHNLGVEDTTELALDSGQATVEVIASKRSYALKWCKPNNEDDDFQLKRISPTFQVRHILSKLYHWEICRITFVRKFRKATLRNTYVI